MKSFNKGDIWFCNNLGDYSEGILSGPRPVLIISNNKWNGYSPVINVIPISSNTKKHSPVHFKINLNKKSVINVEQILTIPKTNLEYYILSLNNDDLIKINEMIKYQLDL